MCRTEWIILFRVSEFQEKAMAGRQKLILPEENHGEMAKSLANSWRSIRVKSDARANSWH
jgi:hypothetical protein